MKKITLKGRLAIIAAIILAGIIIFGGKGDAAYDINTYSENYIPVSEVKAELGFSIYEEKEWDTFFGEYHKDYLTVQMLEQILSRLGVSEYIALPDSLQQSAVTRSQWNEVYLQMLDYLDTNKKVTKGTALILGSMKAEEGNVLFTSEEDIYTTLPAAFFEQWKAYELYYIEEMCVGIYGVSKEACSISNAYLTGGKKGEVAFLFQGASYQLPITGDGTEFSNIVCDLILIDGVLDTIRQKQDYIKGNLLSYDEKTIEIDGYGKINHSGKIPVYQTYGEISEKSISDVVLGNMEAEYIIGGTEVCAILIKEPASIADIRVLLLAEDGTKFRKEVCLKCDTEAIIMCKTTEKTIDRNLVILAEDYVSDNHTTLSVEPAGENGKIYLCDKEGNALSNGYRGRIEVRLLKEGYTVVNSVPFETYLCAVVPSEMPSSYAPEALKAQAVCARSYAYIQLMRADLAAYGAHINDSTSYQVYNKIPESEEAMNAVYETSGKVMTYEGDVIEAYYFSTSMGYTDTAAVWNVKDNASYGYLKNTCLNKEKSECDLSAEEGFKEYIKTDAEGFDSDAKFYRWEAQADYREKTKDINSILESRRKVSEENVIYYEAGGKNLKDNLKGFGKLEKIFVKKRSEAGTILTLGLQYEDGYAEVKSEYNIRKVLCSGLKKIIYADGSEAEAVSLLPSACCTVEELEDGSYRLLGGGYGHGLGMSQNGANGMAKAGNSFEEILNFFYQDIKIEDIWSMK